MPSPEELARPKMLEYLESARASRVEPDASLDSSSNLNTCLAYLPNADQMLKSKLCSVQTPFLNSFFSLFPSRVRLYSMLRKFVFVF
jgi:hypothetical protein